MVERKAVELEGERKEWLEGVPVELQPLMSTVNGPLLNWLHAFVGSEDTLFPLRMQRDFQLKKLEICQRLTYPSYARTKPTTISCATVHSWRPGDICT